MTSAARKACSRQENVYCSKISKNAGSATKGFEEIAFQHNSGTFGISPLEHKDAFLSLFMKAVTCVLQKGVLNT